jgi:hypothetical protein
MALVHCVHFSKGIHAKVILTFETVSTDIADLLSYTTIARPIHVFCCISIPLIFPILTHEPHLLIDHKLSPHGVESSTNSNADDDTYKNIN